jgi:hypothetical protein
MNAEQTAAGIESNINKARKCLAMIRDIAGRGAVSQDPEHVGYALQELSQVLVERTGIEERIFEPVPATVIEGLEKLRVELDWVDGHSQFMACQDADRNFG